MDQTAIHALVIAFYGLMTACTVALIVIAQELIGIADILKERHHHSTSS